MSSHQEEEAGPSGLAHHEVIELLGLNTSDSEKEEETNLLSPEEMACSDEDEICQEALDRFERQRAISNQPPSTKWSRRFGCQCGGRLRVSSWRIMSID